MQDTPLADDSIPAGPSPEEEAALLTVDRTSEQFYGQVPKPENLEPESGETSLPPLEDLKNRIPAPIRALIEELFRARFVTVKRIPQRDLKA